MSLLVDSNVLVRLSDPGDPDHGAAVAAVASLVEREETLYVTLQNLTELWRALTGAKTSNGLGYPVILADTELRRLRRLFTLLDEDTPAIETAWHGLILRHQVTGVAVFDARLAATVLAHNLDSIVTFDPGFGRYGVTVLNPLALQP